MKAFQFVEWQQPGQLREVPVPEPGPGQVLVRQIYLSLDPAIRGWMSESKSYLPPIAIGSMGAEVGVADGIRDPLGPIQG